MPRCGYRYYRCPIVSQVRVLQQSTWGRVLPFSRPAAHCLLAYPSHMPWGCVRMRLRVSTTSCPLVQSASSLLTYDPTPPRLCVRTPPNEQRVQLMPAEGQQHTMVGMVTGLNGRPF